MGQVVLDVSISLDGFMAAPNDAPGNGLGDDGMRLHNWMFGFVDEIRIHVVNVLLGGGRRLFDVLPERVELERTGDLGETDGVVHLTYRVKR